MITAIAYVATTLHAPVEIRSDLTAPGRIRVRILPGGVGGWATPGRDLLVDRGVLRDITDPDTTSSDQAAVPVPPAPAPLTAPVAAEDYMQVLLARQAVWIAEHPGFRLFPLPQHFIEDGDEKWVILPDAKPQPKRTPTPRKYRSAESIRTELATVEARMSQIAGSGPDDPAAVNLSPHSRSRAARTAGRRRFAQLDRDLANYAALGRRRDTLRFSLATAEAREANAATAAVAAAPDQETR